MSVARFQLAPVGKTMFPPGAPFPSHQAGDG